MKKNNRYIREEEYEMPNNQSSKFLKQISDSIKEAEEIIEMFNQQDSSAKVFNMIETDITKLTEALYSLKNILGENQISGDELLQYELNRRLPVLVLSLKQIKEEAMRFANDESDLKRFVYAVAEEVRKVNNVRNIIENILVEFDGETLKEDAIVTRAANLARDYEHKTKPNEVEAIKNKLGKGTESFSSFYVGKNEDGELEYWGMKGDPSYSLLDTRVYKIKTPKEEKTGKFGKFKFFEEEGVKERGVIRKSLVQKFIEMHKRDSDENLKLIKSLINNLKIDVKEKEKLLHTIEKEYYFHAFSYGYYSGLEDSYDKFKVQ
jgi:hypothetical protein